MILRLVAAGAIGSAGVLTAAIPVSAAVCDGSSDALGNGGFETPPIPPDTGLMLPAAQVPPWQTTDSNGDIELWGTGFQGVPAGEGGAFAELNANSAGTLYQDVVSTPGATMSWTLLHRGRAGDDSMQVLIGDANVADVNGSAGWNFTSADLTDPNSAWGAHNGDYVVPAGQTCTRFAFRAVSAASGDDSVGNFLDAVAFSVSTPAEPTPTPRPRVTSPPTSTIVGGGSAPADAGFAVRMAALGVLVLISSVAGLTSRRRRSRR